MSGTWVKEEELLKQSKVLLSQKNQSQKGATNMMKSFAPVQLSRKSSIPLKRRPENNNIMLLARSDGEMENSFTRNSVLFSTVKKEVLLSRVDGDKVDNIDRSKESNISDSNTTDEPINLSMKPTEKYIPRNPRSTFSSNKGPKNFLTPSDYQLHHRVSITPIIRIDDEPEVSKDPLEVDDDEDAYLSSSTITTKISRRINVMCRFCDKSYSTQYLCDLHMKSKHGGHKKETCDVCGVKFVNVRAHKEKYHLFVDVDKCHLCGKVVKYLSSHRCPLKQSTKLKETKLECPDCGNLIKQKYLKIHQKNHCVGHKSSSFSNFRTEKVAQEITRKPLHLTRKPVSLAAAPISNNAGALETGPRIKQERTSNQGILLLPR